MPCGGIYPIGESIHKKLYNNHPCWQCGKPGCDLVLVEWDSYLHSACVDEFLRTEEGKIVLVHNHEVWVIKDGKPFKRYPEGCTDRR